MPKLTKVPHVALGKFALLKDERGVETPETFQWTLNSCCANLAHSEIQAPYVTDSLWFNFFWQLDSTDVLLCCNGQQAMPQNLSQGLTAVDTPAEPAACQIQMSENLHVEKRRSVSRFSATQNYTGLFSFHRTYPGCGTCTRPCCRWSIRLQETWSIEALKHPKCIFQPTYIAAIRY